MDMGGLYRDMLSSFWDEAYRQFFDAGSPVLHPQLDVQVLPLLGKILSHGYLGTGFLPVSIAFPVLVAILLKCTEMSDQILISAFLQAVSAVDADLLTRCLCATEFSASQQTQLTGLLSCFGSRQLPTPQALRRQVVEAAKFEFLMKPSAALHCISSGVPDSHGNFWRVMSVESLHSIYMALSASPQKVLEMLKEPVFLNQSQEKVFNFLRQYIGNMKANELNKFLRFVTGNSVCTSTGIRVTFNCLSEVERRPIAHVCSNMLELTSTYLTYQEFSEEFQAVLYSGVWRRFDGV